MANHVNHPDIQTEMREVGEKVVACRRCARLVAWRERIAREKRAAYADEVYWGRPVPGFGDAIARLLIVGLAPAAHGGNRTGRVFTGDRSGEWLFRALHETGFANQPHSTRRDDGLLLRDAYVTATVRCAPPKNRPSPEERNACLPYLVREIELLSKLRVIVALGAFAWDGVLRALTILERAVPKPRPRFTHQAEVAIGRVVLLGSFHPSQQNTFTGKLTAYQFRAVFEQARKLLQNG